MPSRNPIVLVPEVRGRISIRSTWKIEGEGVEQPLGRAPKCPVPAKNKSISPASNGEEATPKEKAKGDFH